MGRWLLTAKMLQKIPEQYKENRIYMPEEVEGLEYVYGDNLSDDYHQVIQIKRHDWRTDDLKQYIMQTQPELNMSNYSIRMYGFESVCVLVGDEQIVFDPNTLNKLKKDYIETNTYCVCVEDYTLELGYCDKEWLADAFPCYLTHEMLSLLANSRFQWSLNLGSDELIERLDEYDDSRHSWSASDVLGFLSDCMAYATKQHCALWIELED